MIREIINGWKNYLIFDPATEEVAENRASICATCNHKKYGAHTAVLKSARLKKVEGYYCGVCKCPLVVKTRSIISKCPKGLW